MKILGINAFHGDASAAIVVDGKLIAAVAEERFNRKKHCAGFPTQAIEFCLKEAGVKHQDLDHIGVSRNPLANLHRKIWHTLASGRLFRRAAWKSAESMFSIGNIRSRFAHEWKSDLNPHTKLHHIEHHLAHAASAYFVSPFKRSAILTLDGFGDFSSGLLAMGHGSQMDVLQRIHFPHSLGTFYTAMTQYLGFPHYGDEGKVMALASFGRPKFLNQMRQMIRFDPESMVRMNLEYFTHYSRGVTMEWGEGSPTIGTLYSQALPELLGPPRKPDEELGPRFHDIAASLQLHLEEIVLQIARHLASLTGERHLCLAGGVALNSVVNGRILDETPFKEIFVQPAASDDGTAIGCAFMIHNQILKNPRIFVMEHANWGPTYSDEEIQAAAKTSNLSIQKLDRPEAAAVEAIARGEVVGWFQGRMEFGPRALGNRSILADARRANMKQILNERVKHRESFRPFAPSLLEEDIPKYFNQEHPSPFMLMVYEARKEEAGNIAGALHVDQTGRLQSVTPQQNERYCKLIQEFKKFTGHGVVINTSFNDGEPIVCSPQDAIHCFLNTKMDRLFMGDYEIKRSS